MEIKYQEREISARGDRVTSVTLPPRSVSTIVCRAAYVGQPFDRTNWGKPQFAQVYLSDLAWAAVSLEGTQGLLREQIQGQGVNVARDANRLNDWLVLDRTRYRKGLGMKAPAEVVYSLDGQYTAFEAVVGLDDAATSDSKPGAIFEVSSTARKPFQGAIRWPKLARSRLLQGVKMKLIVVPAAPPSLSIGEARWFASASKNGGPAG